MATDLTTECRAGMAGEPNPYYWSSDAWLAHLAGAQIRGMSDVRRCWKSRGYSVKIKTAGGNLVTVTARGKRLDQIVVDRA